MRAATIVSTLVSPSGLAPILALATGLVLAPDLRAELGSPPSTGDRTGASSSALAALVQHYLGVPTLEDAELILETILHDPQATLETVTAALRAGRSYTMQPTGLYPRQQVRVLDRVHSFALYVPDSYTPYKDYALVVCLHGAGFTGDAYAERWQARLGEDYILACPTLMAGTWWTREAEELVLATIRLIQNRYRIDPDRIFLTGMSNGGIGTYLIGMHHAPLFAGLAPMASGLDDVLLPLLENLTHTPVYIIHGARDQVMPVESSRAIVRELQRLGISHVYREHTRVHPQAGGHFFPREELPDLIAWFGTRRRTPVPSRLTVVRDASHLVPFGWVRIDATDRIAAFTDQLTDSRDDAIVNRLYAKVDARLAAPNRIEVQTQRVRRYTLFFNDTLVDFNTPVTIVTNGQISYTGPVTPGVETLLREARHRQDRGMLFPAKLSVEVDTRP